MHNIHIYNNKIYKYIFCNVLILDAPPLMSDQFAQVTVFPYRACTVVQTKRGS